MAKPISQLKSNAAFDENANYVANTLTKSSPQSNAPPLEEELT